MFTGIIEDVGTIIAIDKSNTQMMLKISTGLNIKETCLGDSIAINGVCLTVKDLINNVFSFDVMPETYHNTALATYSSGVMVNLERALQIGGRLGGHFVSGHIDCTGVVTRIRHIENARYMDIRVTQAKLLAYAIMHGSIAIDGTSLTIFGLTANTLTVSLIPHTAKNTVLGSKGIGDVVNLEFDMLAKFVNRSLSNANSCSEIDNNFLVKHGFMGMD